MSNEEREQAVALLQQQTLKVKHYEKIIDVLQSSPSTKLDKHLSSIKKPIEQYSLAFIYALSPLVNRQ